MVYFVSSAHSLSQHKHSGPVILNHSAYFCSPDISSHHGQRDVALHQLPSNPALLQLQESERSFCPLLKGLQEQQKGCCSWHHVQKLWLSLEGNSGRKKKPNLETQNCPRNPNHFPLAREETQSVFP